MAYAGVLSLAYSLWIQNQAMSPEVIRVALEMRFYLQYQRQKSGCGYSTTLSLDKNKEIKYASAGLPLSNKPCNLSLGAGLQEIERLACGKACQKIERCPLKR